jgi:hypothetical protein
MVNDGAVSFQPSAVSFFWHQILSCGCPRSVVRRLFKQLVAVVVGSLLYFFVLMPHLPLAGRHQPFRIDLGLVLNLWVCLVLYGILEWLDRTGRRNGRTTETRKR